MSKGNLRDVLARIEKRLQQTVDSQDTHHVHQTDDTAAYNNINNMLVNKKYNIATARFKAITSSDINQPVLQGQEHNIYYRPKLLGEKGFQPSLPLKQADNKALSQPHNKNNNRHNNIDLYALAKTWGMWGPMLTNLTKTFGRETVQQAILHVANMPDTAFKYNEPIKTQRGKYCRYLIMHRQMEEQIG